VIPCRDGRARKPALSEVEGSAERSSAFVAIIELT
jgi:hypothetical protein